MATEESYQNKVHDEGQDGHEDGRGNPVREEETMRVMSENSAALVGGEREKSVSEGRSRKGAQVHGA